MERVSRRQRLERQKQGQGGEAHGRGTETEREKEDRAERQEQRTRGTENKSSGQAYTWLQREGVERQDGDTYPGRGLASRVVSLPSRAPGFRGGGGEGSSGLTSLPAKSR